MPRSQLVEVVDYCPSAEEQFIIPCVGANSTRHAQIEHNHRKPLSDLCHDTYYGPRPQRTIHDPLGVNLLKRSLVELGMVLPLLGGTMLLQIFNMPVMTWILDLSRMYFFINWFISLWSFAYERQYMQVFAGTSGLWTSPPSGRCFWPLHWTSQSECWFEVLSFQSWSY